MTRMGIGAASPSALVAGIAGVDGPAQADDAQEAKLIGFRELCDHGDCVKFGMLLQQNRDRHDAWRRRHPEFFFFER